MYQIKSDTSCRYFQETFLELNHVDALKNVTVNVKLKRFKFFSVPCYHAIKTYNGMAVKFHTFLHFVIKCR